MAGTGYYMGYEWLRMGEKNYEILIKIDLMEIHVINLN